MASIHKKWGGQGLFALFTLKRNLWAEVPPWRDLRGKSIGPVISDFGFFSYQSAFRNRHSAIWRGLRGAFMPESAILSGKYDEHDVPEFRVRPESHPGVAEEGV